MTSAPREISDALGLILNQDFRKRLYAEITEGVHEGFDAGTYSTLSALARCLSTHESVSAATLAGSLGLDRSVVSRRCSALARDGLISIDRPPHDERKALLSLTPAGEAAIGVARERLDAAISARTRGWTAEELATFARLIGRFAGDGPLPLTEAQV